MRTRNLLLLLIILSLLACKRNPFKVDVSDIQLDVKINRFDRDLFALKKDGLQNLDQLKRHYAEYFKLYSFRVIGLGDPQDPRYPEYLEKFLNDSTMSLVYQRCQEVFPDMKAQEHELNDAFRHLKYYFPGKDVPQLFAHISGFNQSMVVAQNILAISLDKYLGADCELYAQLGTPLYARYKMEPQRIPVDAMLAYGLTEFEYGSSRDNLIGNMIYQGKIRYFVQAMMPEVAEEVIMGYKPEQMEWCQNNEDVMWGYLIEQKHLFSSEYRLIMRYINDGPFTQGMPPESPSRTGIWLGWQIVKAYMKKHPELDLPKLMAEQDYEKMLRESGFQP